MRKLRRTRITSADYTVTAENCWIWRGCLVDGHGHVKMSGRTLKAHRVMYEQECGPIPAGAVIDHLCRNRACVNPDHLEAVTRDINSQRSPLFVVLSPDDVRAIRKSEESGAAIARRYGISRNQIWRVRSGRCWANITP